MIGLKKEDPRAGKRKPIEESEDEEDTKRVSTILCSSIFRTRGGQSPMARQVAIRTSLSRLRKRLKRQ